MPEYIPNRHDNSEHIIKMIPDDTTITRNDSASSNQVPAFTGFNYATVIDYKDPTVFPYCVCAIFQILIHIFI